MEENMVEILNSHYVRHSETGLPVRIPPGLRRDLSVGAPSSDLYLKAITENPFVNKYTSRTPEDTVRNNFEENVRLRRFARRASRELVDIAESLGEERYITVVCGSLAMGLVRQPTSHDPSDIDIHLILGSSAVPKDRRIIIQEHMNGKGKILGAKIDAHVFTLEELKRNKGHFARNYIESAAYPIVNKDNLWEEVVAIGLQCIHFARFGWKKKKQLQIVLQFLANGDEDGMLDFLFSLRNPLWRNGVFTFLSLHNIFGDEKVQQNARETYELFSS